VSRFRLKTIICKICNKSFDTYQVKSGVCKECQKKIHQKKYYQTHKEEFLRKADEYRQNNKHTIRKRNKDYYIKNKMVISKKQKEWYLNNNKHRMCIEDYLSSIRKEFKDWTTSVHTNIKKKARFLLQRAVSKKRIIKSNICSQCNKRFLIHKIHGHHENYDKWWDIIWLCEKCHKNLHKELTEGE